MDDFHVQGLFLQIQLIFPLLTGKWTQKYRSKAAFVMAASCGYHILRKLLKNGAAKPKA
jgi:hypothetical protein